MKFLKKVLAAIACVCVLVTSMTLTSYAAGGRISFTDPNTAVGDMVDIKCVLKSSSGSIGSASVTLSYDTSALKFNSGDGVTGGDGTLTYTGDGSSSEVSFTMTFQALKEGSTEVTVASQDVKSSSGSEIQLTEGKSTVKIAAGDPSKIVADTQTAEGSDTAASGDVTVDVNGTSYTLSDFVDASIPAGFAKTTMNYEGADRPMAYNEKSGIYLAYLTSAEGNSNFFLYDDSNATFAPYEEIDISDTTSIVLLSDTSMKLPSNYVQTTLTLNGQEFPVWQDNDKDGFYLMYAVNNNGTKNFYEYDSQENTYQRCDIKQDTGASNVKKKANSFFDKLQNVVNGHFKIFAIIFIIVLLLLIIRLIVVRVKLRNRDIELDQLYDEYGIDLEDEEPEPAPKKKNKKKAEPVPKKSKKKVIDEDDFDDYDDDEFDDDDQYDDGDYADEDYADDDYADDDYADDNFEEEEFDEVREAPLRTVKFDDFNTITDMSLYEDENFESFMMDEDEEDDMVDDLDDLLSERPKEKRSHSEKDDTFQVDYIDLD